MATLQQLHVTLTRSNSAVPRQSSVADRAMLRLFFLVSTLFLKAQAFNVVLIPSTGCYSHDVMMRQVGEALGPTANITWIQTFIFDFGFGEIPLPSGWTRISLYVHSDEGMEVMRTAGSLMWEQNVPIDLDRPWDLRGPFIFYKMLEQHQTHCERMLDDQRLLQFLRTQKIDVIVLDHLLQECMGGLAYIFNSSVIQYSNWPVADATPYSGHGMPFLHRLGNTLSQIILIVTRYYQLYVLNSMFARRGSPQFEAIQLEAERVFYAGRSELLFEVVRPINNRVKHFSGVSKMNPRDYVTLLPEMNSRKANPVNCRAPATGFRHLNISLSSATWSNSTAHPLTFINCVRSSKSAVMRSLAIRRPQLYEGLAIEDVKKRFDAVSNEFPQLYWSSLTTEPFILVSFGSIAQTNSAFESLLWARNVTVPKNVRLSSWVPVKHILAHPNLQYLISHGGINTINELLLFGVPMLGVHLQLCYLLVSQLCSGDQVSNLQRLVDLGAAAKMSVKDIAQGELLTNMRRFERKLDRSKIPKFTVILFQYCPR
ncbi:hypothetical protein GCK32_011542 [Trichostrongylus colubriformis]|uniref:glucuronosyltransferase n=1 Tax=Trichostrongylus colubriformis TaxID=6319 RepID=A0AAN8IIU4_TRICO